MATPFLSVCLITYNHERYLRKAIEGVLMQEVDFEIELIIADDFSTDATRSIIEEYRLKHPTIIKPILQAKNIGAANNWMDLMEAPVGKYVAYQDGDDYWTDPLKLQKQVDFLENHPNAVMCFTNIEVFDDDTQKLGPYWTKTEDKQYNVIDLINENVAPSCSIVFRNHLVDLRSSGISILSIGDWPFYILLLQFGYAKYMDFISAVYRVRSSSMFSKISFIRQLKMKSEVYNFFLQKPAFAKYKNEFKKAYCLNAYFLAIRLEKKDPMRKSYLKEVINNFRYVDFATVCKAAVKYFY